MVKNEAKTESAAHTTRRALIKATNHSVALELQPWPFQVVYICTARLTPEKSSSVWPRGMTRNGTFSHRQKASKLGSLANSYIYPPKGNFQIMVII